MEETPNITYVVGAGPYPYRADGRRMSETEAASYLIEVHSMGYARASRYLDMITTQAVRDAGTPVVKRTIASSRYEYSISGAEPTTRVQATRSLIVDWRLTPAEAASALDHALTRGV